MERGRRTSPERMLLYFLRALRRFWALLLVLPILGAGFMYFKAKRGYVPQYAAASTFTVRVSGSVNTQYYNSATAAQMSRTFPYILESGLLSEIVAQDLGLGSLPCSISAQADGNTSLFTITVTAQDPQLAYDVLQSVIRNYPSVAGQVLGDTTMTLLTETGVPEAPTNSPDYPKRCGQGAILGFLGAIAAVAILSASRRTVSSREDLKGLLSVDCLGMIPPALKGRERAGEQILITNRGVRESFADAIQLLRSRFTRAAEEQEAKTILVSSALPGEGKTTIAVNLSLALAEKGKRVALVDCDLRNPSIAPLAGGEGAKEGLSQFLGSIVEAEEIISRSGLLLLIHGGAAVKNAAELLGSRRMGQLLEALGRETDYIILDTPPCSALTDAMVLAPMADAALLVVQQDRAPREQIRRAVAHLSESGARILGCVLNRAQDGRGGYGYYGRYGRQGGYARSRNRDRGKG